jgi:hypothetical protein
MAMPGGKIWAVVTVFLESFLSWAALKNSGGIVGGRCFDNFKAYLLKGIGSHGANVRIGLHNENNSWGGGYRLVNGDRDT